MNPSHILWFQDISHTDVPLVGGKTASLGEMYQALSAQGVLVPNGFAVTADAYRLVLDEADAWGPLKAALQGLDPDSPDDLAKRARKAREIVHNAAVPAAMRQEILDAYHQLLDEYGPETTLAVRSSATAEDLPTASFAGQQETFLNVSGEEAVIEAFRRCMASLFTDRAIHYRITNGFDHFSVALSVCMMKMVRADLASSGVMFTLDTESGFRDAVFLTGAFGLGENVVQGTVQPDEFYVHKPTFRKGFRTVLKRTLGTKALKMIYGQGRDGSRTRNLPTTDAERSSFCLTDEEVLTLTGYAIAIEEHYSALATDPRPMDIEWAKDGLDGSLYIVQARPETAVSQRGTELVQYVLKGEGEMLVKGNAVGTGIAHGPVRVIQDPSELGTFVTGEVLVAETTNPDWEPVMKRASAIVTERGGRTCHAAILARELNIPAVVGATDAVAILTGRPDITVSCAEGADGRVYDGEVPFKVLRTNVGELARPSTKIMLNLANPGLAFQSSFIPCDGVGLARTEFIISQSVGVHPMALAHPERVTDAAIQAKIRERISGHASGTDYFVERLSEGVGQIAAAFYPRPVIVRMSDFKTNEYAQLLGGADFEPVEANPMIGFRGASRYAHPAYADGFELECLAMRRVREEMGLTNVKLMIPFCRRVDEAEKVLALMARHGLGRGVNGLEIYVMCEIPNNVVQIDAFAPHFDGFSIGSNDLTQLTLGVDRDSEMVAFEFDERDPGVMEMLRLAVEGARRNDRHSGICGQAPSDYPEVAEFLVKHGIDSISLTPDAVIATTLSVLSLEAKLKGEEVLTPASRATSIVPIVPPRPVTR
ncbi:Phosphoenolpyruvate synthase [Planctomycetes bacterium Poly30]|uniref:Phosphoenolpyruvate synthase n=1 Tax=Saltatorellus ferox TaxID=2528018 RepID=A0A518EVH2_9BACT|nr:Phosphoenolpyruvate synthase [Planctomycetes bacterium Poly30]